jgi:hypothetical protein
MKINLKQIATIHSPFYNLVNMPVQPSDTKSGWMVSNIDEVSNKKSDDRFI